MSDGRNGVQVNKAAMVLHLETYDHHDNDNIRRVTLLRDDDGHIEVEIFHQFEGLKPKTDDTILDGNILSVLLYAMSRKMPLLVHGPVSRTMFRNLDELQNIWSRWKPEVYTKIKIIPDSVVDIRNDKKAEKRAISAFSGGVDGTFTALRNTTTLDKNIRHDLTHVMIVHGFDVGLNNEKDFAALKSRIMPLLNELNLSLIEIKTNSKDWERQHWNDSFALELAACLHLVSDEFSYGLIGSSEPYEALVLPWGSSPVTDHLMSGDAFRIVHDGAGYSRSEKVHLIAQNPTACTALKVCWAGENQATNCGTCEKCIRTMLNFIVTGHQVPDCFPNGLVIKDIQKIKIHSSAQISELQLILETGKQNGLSQKPWAAAVRKRIRKAIYRRVVGQALQYIGIKQEVKRLLRFLGANNYQRAYPESCVTGLFDA